MIALVKYIRSILPVTNPLFRNDSVLIPIDTLLRFHRIGALERQMKAGPTRRLLKLKEACEYLSMSRWQLRKLVAMGKLRFIQVEPRSHILFDVTDLDALAESLKQKY